MRVALELDRIAADLTRHHGDQLRALLDVLYQRIYNEGYRDGRQDEREEWENKQQEEY